MYAQLPKNIAIGILCYFFITSLTTAAFIAFVLEIIFMALVLGYYKLMPERMIDQGSVLFDIIAPNFHKYSSNFSYEAILTRMGFRALALWLITQSEFIVLGMIIVILTLLHEDE